MCLKKIDTFLQKHHKFLTLDVKYEKLLTFIASILFILFILCIYKHKLDNVLIFVILQPFRDVDNEITIGNRRQMGFKRI